MIVPGGGISLDGQRWIACRPGFFLPPRMLSRPFRRLVLDKLAAAHAAGRLNFFGDHATLTDAQAFAAYIAPLRQTEWVVRLVLVFHGQTLSDPDLIAFSKNFGELDPPGPNPYGSPFNKQYPELNVISNVIQDGRPIGHLGDGEAVWHADMTYEDVPPKAALLHALEVPPAEAGGNTYFANMFAAYETLPAELKVATTGKIAVHDASRNSAGMLRKGYKEVTDVRETVGARHPVVRTDPAAAVRRCFSGADRTPTCWASAYPRANPC